MPNASFDQRNDELIQELTGSGQLKPFYDITTPMRPIVNIRGKGEVRVMPVVEDVRVVHGVDGYDDYAIYSALRRLGKCSGAAQ